MNFKFKFERRHIPLAIIVAVGILSLVIVTPLAGRVDAARNQFTLTRLELDKFQSEIWRLGELDRAKLKVELLHTQIRFLSGENLTPLIDEVSDLAEGYGLSVDSLTPRERKTAEAADPAVAAVLDQVPIELKIVGSYEEIVEFLSDLEHLAHGVVRVVALKMNKSETSVQLIDMVLQIHVYVEKESIENALQGSAGYDVPVERNAAESRSDGFGRNPFTKASLKRVGSFKLEGIIYDPSSPMALIGGDVKRVGDQVGNATITEIRPDSVLYKIGDEEGQIRIEKD